MAEQTKSLFASKTFWVNAIAMVINLAPAVGISIPGAAPVVAIVLPIANVLLRTITNQPVSLSGK